MDWSVCGTRQFIMSTLASLLVEIAFSHELLANVLIMVYWRVTICGSIRNILTLLCFQWRWSQCVVTFVLHFNCVIQDCRSTMLIYFFHVMLSKCTISVHSSFSNEGNCVKIWWIDLGLLHCLNIMSTLAHFQDLRASLVSLTSHHW